MQKPLPPDCWLDDHVFGSESTHVYVPLMTTGFVVVEKFTVQLTFGAPPWPDDPVALYGPSTPPLVPSPIVPGFAPFALFQWYVVTELTQYAAPFGLKLGDLPPLLTPNPFESSKSFTCAPLHV